MSLRLLWLALLLAAAPALADEPPEFRELLTGRPLDLSPGPDEQLTAAVRGFHATGRNPYMADRSAIEAGRRLYTEECAFCHGRGGGGALGPPLTGPNWTYYTAAEDVGMFSIIYGGAYGAMDGYGHRKLRQDQVLRIIAYVRTLEQPAEATQLSGAAQQRGADAGATIQR